VRRCRVAATQVDVRHGDVEHNLETHVRLIAETAEAGCDLVVFPELSVTGHNGSPEVTRDAEPADGRIARVIADAARAGGIVVSYGFCELHRGTRRSTSSSGSARRTTGRCSTSASAGSARQSATTATSSRAGASWR
jgi:predicted amidohydrolase